MTVTAGMCPGAFFCQRRWQWLFQCRLSWCLQICLGCAFSSRCDQVTPPDECQTDLWIKKAQMCPCLAQGTAWIGYPWQESTACSPVQWYCSIHSTFTCSLPLWVKQWEWTYKGFNSEFCAETQIIKCRMSGKKEITTWIQFLEMW